MKRSASGLALDNLDPRERFLYPVTRSLFFYIFHLLSLGENYVGKVLDVYNSFLIFSSLVYGLTTMKWGHIKKSNCI